MIAIGVRTSGGALEIIEIREPRDPQAGELVVNVFAAGIGPYPYDTSNLHRRRQS